jgi:prepilin-type N-terminal cleavage/methylation domain-containing protein
VKLAVELYPVGTPAGPPASTQRPLPRWNPSRHPRGVTLIEVVVVVIIIGLAFLVLLMILPQGREQARMLGCQKNLSHIGVALALYDQSHQQLPAIAMVSAADGPGATRWPGPLRTLLETLQLPDLTELQDPKAPPPARPGQVPGEARVPGFVCSSDPNATAGLFAAPISYRATTGDTPAGDDGPFAVGRVTSLKNVQAFDGLSYTAGFSERLVGDNIANHASIGNYQLVPGPLSGTGCAMADAGALWRSDAGSSWMWADYRQTLYNHAQAPNARTSCVADDGKTAFMGASSGHLRGLNLLLLDGSVTLVTRNIDLRIWKEFATVNRQQPR